MQDIKSKTPTPAKPQPVDPFSALVEMMGNDIRANGVTRPKEVAVPTLVAQSSTPKSAKKASKIPRLSTPLKNAIQEGVNLKQSAAPALVAITEVPEVQPEIEEATTPAVEEIQEEEEEEEVEKEDVREDEKVEKEEEEILEEEDQDDAFDDSEENVTRSFPAAPPPTPCAVHLRVNEENEEDETSSAPSSPFVIPKPAYALSIRKLATPLRKDIQSKIPLKTRQITPAPAVVAEIVSAVVPSPVQETPQKLVDLQGLADMMTTPTTDSKRVPVSIIPSRRFADALHQSASSSHIQVRSHPTEGTKIRVPVANEVPLIAAVTPSKEIVPAASTTSTPATATPVPVPTVEAEEFALACLDVVVTPEKAVEEKLEMLVQESPASQVVFSTLSARPKIEALVIPTDEEVKEEVKEDIKEDAKEEKAEVNEITAVEIVSLEPEAPIEAAPVLVPEAIVPEVEVAEQKEEAPEEETEEKSVATKSTRGRKRKAQEPEEQPKAKRVNRCAAQQPEEDEIIPAISEVTVDPTPEPAAQLEEAVVEGLSFFFLFFFLLEPELMFVLGLVAPKTRGRKRAQTPVASEIEVPIVVAVIEEAPVAEVAVQEEKPVVTAARRGRKPKETKEPTPEPVIAAAVELIAEHPTKRGTRGAASKAKEPTPQPEIAPLLETIPEEPEVVAEEAAVTEEVKPKTRTLRGKKVQKLEVEPEPTPQTRKRAASEEVVAPKPTKAARTTRGKKQEDEEQPEEQAESEDEVDLETVKAKAPARSSSRGVVKKAEEVAEPVAKPAVRSTRSSSRN